MKIEEFIDIVQGFTNGKSCPAYGAETVEIPVKVLETVLEYMRVFGNIAIVMEGGKGEPWLLMSEDGEFWSRYFPKKGE